MSSKVTITKLWQMKKSQEKIVALTAYDASFAQVEDSAGVEIALVGDSLGMVLHGEMTTLKVSMADMIYHTCLVSRACQRAMVVTDMPFMSYATSAQALANAARLVSEGGAEMVKLEGASDHLLETVHRLDEQGILVCAHLGLTPQFIHKIGGYRPMGKDTEDAVRILVDARSLQEAGASMLVLECVPEQLAADITGELDIPVIGIGAGAQCDGQVLVIYDLLGISAHQPRFARNFLAEASSVEMAIKTYVADVKSGKFPAAEL